MKDKKNPKKPGTLIDGIAASEHLDSAGERIEIKGIDISSLTIDGLLNFEHKSDTASQIVGKILSAKKIFQKSDCKNDRQRYFWDKIKTPYLYITGELFDAVGHQGAKDVVAMLKYDQEHKKVNAEERKLINFSIEGQKLEKRGSIIKKCIARKISITLVPCNKVCEAEELKNPEKVEKSDKFSMVQDLMTMTKTETSSCQMLKNMENYNPKRTFTTDDAPDNVRTGDRIVNTGPKAKTGVDVYGKPPKFDASGKKVGEGTDPKPPKPPEAPKADLKPESNEGAGLKLIKPLKGIDGKKPLSMVKNSKRKAIISNLKKSLTAGSMVGVPGTLSGGTALTKEDLNTEMHTVCGFKTDEKKKKKKKKKLEKVEFQGKNKRPGTFFPDSVEKSEAIKILKFVETKYPKMNKKEQIALAKTVAVLRRAK